MFNINTMVPAEQGGYNNMKMWGPNVALMLFTC